jgi:hypothetical protein
MMAVVEVSWDDQFGTRHSSSAKLEDTSPSGACLRVKVPVAIGSAMKVNSYRERFSGTARYCRSDRRDYLVGVQKDKNTNRSLTDVMAQYAASAVPFRNGSGAENREDHLEKPREEIREVTSNVVIKPTEVQGKNQNPPIDFEPRSKYSVAVMPSRTAARGVDNESVAKKESDARVSRSEFIASPSPARFQSQPSRSGNLKGRENMPNKWSDLAPWRQKQTGKEHDASSDDAQATPASSPQAVDTATRGEKSKPNPMAGSEAAVGANPTPCSPGDLLSMDDIYRAAGILTPRMGYSIRKVADMLASDHLRGQSDEMKRASVLMALDAAGISVDEVLRDAAMRQSAINSYESDQWEHFEEYWAAKATENTHVQAELERITAQYQERIKRNLDEIAREKVVFAQWQTMKQQEAERIGEAAGICSKPSIEETFDEPQRSPRSLVATAKQA